MPVVTILSGSNAGDRFQILRSAQTRVVEALGSLLRISGIYETAPWGFESNQHFLNQVFCIETELSTREILTQLLKIEQDLGRERDIQGGYADRLIDLDILFHGNLIIDQPGLHVPHPRIPERRFVLAPLAEIMPLFVHPVLGMTVTDLLSECEDQGLVTRTNF